MKNAKHLLRQAWTLARLALILLALLVLWALLWFLAGIFAISLVLERSIDNVAGPWLTDRLDALENTLQGLKSELKEPKD